MNNPSLIEKALGPGGPNQRRLDMNQFIKMADKEKVDADLMQDLADTIKEDYKKEKKISILLASHNMDEVKRLCSSVLMMKDGIIVDSGTPDDLIKKHGRRNLEEVFLELVRNKNEFS